MRLGYVSPISFGPKGDVIGGDDRGWTAQSFDQMTGAAFNLFHQQATELIAREMGIDMGAV
ncbi:MAG: hypothetical protein U5N55_11920 [Cypionkella sp.]|nr:hypothetical protein [Cypionkella sp.]